MVLQQMTLFGPPVFHGPPPMREKTHSLSLKDTCATPDWAQWQRLSCVAQKALAARDKECFESEGSLQAMPSPSPEPSPLYTLTSEDLDLLGGVVKDCCYRFGVLDEYDDLLQDMVVEVLRHNLLARYDPTKGASRKTFLGQFIYHRFCNLYQKRNRIQSRLHSLEEVEVSIGIEPEVGTLEPTLLPILEGIAQQLQAHSLPTSGVYYELEPFAFRDVVAWSASPKALPGHVIVWRDGATIFRLLCLGLTQRDIAHVLRLSFGNVCHRINDIRAWPGVQALYQWLRL